MIELPVVKVCFGKKNYFNVDSFLVLGGVVGNAGNAQLSPETLWIICSMYMKMLMMSR